LNSEFGERIFVLTNKAIYNSTIKYPKPEANDLMWWTFEGLTSFLEEGEV
jgi:hypothetical protein